MLQMIIYDSSKMIKAMDVMQTLFTRWTLLKTINGTLIKITIIKQNK